MYTALVLDQASHNKLVEKLKTQIPTGWKIYCHHMTINMGNATKGPEADNLNKSAKVTVVAFGFGQKVVAVKVTSDVKSNNETKHITVAVDVNNGGKPFMSNQIIDWTNIDCFELVGTIQEVN